MKPNFKDINIKATTAKENTAEWVAKNKIEKNWKTPEQIPVKPVYTKEDLEGMEHLNYAAGVAPFLRGPYSSMYVMQPWTIRQYAGFSTAEIKCILPPQPGCRTKRIVGCVRPCHTPRLRL